MLSDSILKESYAVESFILRGDFCPQWLLASLGESLTRTEVTLRIHSKLQLGDQSVTPLSGNQIFLACWSSDFNCLTVSDWLCKCQTF